MKISTLFWNSSRTYCDAFPRRLQVRSVKKKYWLRCSTSTCNWPPPYSVRFHEGVVRHMSTSSGPGSDIDKRDGDASMRSTKMAEKIATKMLTHSPIKLEDTLVLDCNEANGIVSRALLEAGVGRVCGLIKKSTDSTEFELLKDEYSGRYDIADGTALRNFGGKKVQHCFKGFEEKTMAKDPSWILFVGVDNAGQHLCDLPSHLLYQGWMFSYGKPYIFLLLHDRYIKLLDVSYMLKKRYTRRMAFLNLFFDTKVITKVPVSFMKPLGANNGKPTEDEMVSSIQSEENLNLILVTPKNDLYTEVCDEDNIQDMDQFFKTLLNKPTMSVVAKIGSMNADIGLELIKKGYSMNTTIRECPPQELLKIFQLFKVGQIAIKKSEG